MPKKGPPFQRRRGLRRGVWRGLRWENWPSPDLQDEASSPTEVEVGVCLRRLREERNYTLRTLAERSGLAVNTLSLIENQKSSPSVSTLQQLAVALEVPITAFFESQEPDGDIAYLRAGRSPRAKFNQGLLEDLGAGLSNRAVEPFLVSLDSLAGSGSQDIVHTGYEFVYCLKGQVAYTVAGESYPLQPGDSLLFEAHLPHRWQNMSSERSRMLLVLYPTDERDHPTERHFIPGKT
jgi:transcriptional regulator with XRE-family HTH domain